MNEKKKTGRTDRKKAHPTFTGDEITDDNLQLFLAVFPEEHKQFAEEYLLSWNAKQAYLNTHPKVKESTAKVNGHKLLRTDKVQLYIEYLGKKNQEKFEISKEWLMVKQKQILDQAMAAVPVLDPFGKPTGKYIFNAQAANQAVRNFGYEVGFATPQLKVEHSGSRKMMAAVFVVEELRPIDMVDPKFQQDLNNIVREKTKKK